MERKQYRQLRISVEQGEADRIISLSKRTGIPVSRMINALIRDGLGAIENRVQSFNLNMLDLEEGKPGFIERLIPKGAIHA